MNTDLDNEQDLVDSFERGEWRSVPNAAEEIARFGAMARANFAQNNEIKVLLSASDIRNLQTKAADEGMPYEALMASVLHKFGAGRLVEAR
jgi:predicted DNA binding CopG/RHH family protein